VKHPDSPASKSFMEIVRKIEDFLKQNKDTTEKEVIR